MGFLFAAKFSGLISHHGAPPRRADSTAHGHTAVLGSGGVDVAVAPIEIWALGTGAVWFEVSAVLLGGRGRFHCVIEWGISGLVDLGLFIG